MSEKSIRILIAEDNETMREGMAQVLQKSGYTIEMCTSGSEALQRFQKQRYDLVITDYKMADLNGLDLLKALKKRAPETEVIVITAFGSIELAVDVMKAGAWDFVTKPFSKEEFKLKVNRACDIIKERHTSRLLAEENQYLRDETLLRFNFGEIVGESSGMKAIYKLVEKVAASESSVIIYGESGTGKELVARAIHNHSIKRNNPFIKVNCGALAEGVLESELFGHEKGAFTGAIRRKRGRFELADRGTLFLDEIGDISLGTQVKLLRVLQEKEFERVGGEETLKVDVRVIAATNRNLRNYVEEGKFREDLYYRLHVLPVELPPLRERKEDLPLLASHFLKRITQDTGNKEVNLTQDAIDILTAYNWPGNVRELENVLERVIVLTEGDAIDRESLSFLIGQSKGTMIADNPMNLEATLAAHEKDLLQRALVSAKGVKARAARILGIKESSLYYKLEKFGLLEKRESS